MSDLALIPPSSIQKYKDKRDFHQAKVDSLNELIQRLENNSELVRVMDLVRHVEREDY